MSPENDQCRWVGIRPVNPPEDIPVTLDAEVVHVIVDSGGSGDLSPGAVKHHYEQKLGCVVDVWNTSLNLTDCAGYLRCVGLNPGTGSMLNWHLRITIDGTVGDDIDFNDLIWGFIPDAAGTDCDHILIPLGSVRFTTSLKIELMTDIDNKAYRFNAIYTLDL